MIIMSSSGTIKMKLCGLLVLQYCYPLLIAAQNSQSKHSVLEAF